MQPHLIHLLLVAAVGAAASAGCAGRRPAVVPAIGSNPSDAPGPALLLDVVPAGPPADAATQAAAAPRRPPRGPSPVDPAESILSEDVPQAAPNPSPPPYTLLRFNEDYRYLADPANRDDPFDALKYLPLSARDPTVYLSLGGEVRERFEAFSNPDFGVGGPAHDDYLLQRVAVHADLHLGDRLRFFVQGISGLQVGQDGDPSPVNQNPLELQQAFADVVAGDPEAHDARVTFRGGRFEFTFGSGRLVATRAAPNIPFKFDGVEVIAAREKARLYAFLVRPAEEQKYRFDGENDRQTFWGAYGTAPLGGPLNTSVDLYYLGLRDEDAAYASGAGTEERHTVGTRVFGRADGWDYDLEPVLQFGRFDGRDLLAWTLATDVGYTFAGLPWTPRLGLKADAASGDDTSGEGTPGGGGGRGGGGGTLGTFNPLFFKAGYFNDASLLRPSNVVDVHPSLQLHPSDALLLTVATNSIWRYTTDDAIYGPGGNVQIAAGAGGGRFVGQTVEAAVTWEVGRHLVWTTSYVHLFAGDLPRAAGGGDVDFLGSWLTFTW